jgi:ubiquilin
MADMLSNPAMAQTLNEALNNPAVVDMMIQSNPMLANMPNAREIIQSPYFRNMLTNPDMIRMAERMRRATGGNASSFPAPGATDSTPAGAPASDGANAANTNANPANPFGFPGGAGSNPFASLLGLGANPFGMPIPTAPGQAAGGTAPTAGTQTGRSPTSSDAAGQIPSATNPTGSPPPNPFAALFGTGQGDAAANPFAGLTPEMMQQAAQFWGPMAGMGGPASPPPPPDNRPPEERYAEQLRQLNDMGFYDFDRNVAALRRSGGSVQGAVDQLLNG